MMTHIRIPPIFVAASVAIALAAACAAQDNRGFSCPASLAVSEQAQAPNGWTGEAVKVERPFKTAKIYNGEPGKDEFDLKPDEETKRGKQVVLTWNVKGYRDMNVFVRCFYHDTDATVTASVPGPVSKCSISVELTSGNRIVGKSEMKCQ